MAIVPNLGRLDEPVDRPWHTHNRVTAASPNGVTTPFYAGEIVFDTTNKVRWRALTLANTDWIPLESEVT